MMMIPIEFEQPAQQILMFAKTFGGISAGNTA